MASTNYVNKIISYNCKNVKTSVHEIRQLCHEVDIIALQETWLMPYDISFLGQIHDDFEFHGKSAVDITSGILRGRPHGGVAVLWRKSLFDNVCIIESNNNRIAAIKISKNGCEYVVCSVYMPTDCMENLVIFTECLGCKRCL
nr:uncharacterized protein LOC117989585 [Maniola hyperantus]